MSLLRQPPIHHSTRPVDADSHTHIFRLQRPFIRTDIRFPYLLAEIVVRTPETAIQNTGKGGFRITGIGTGMLAAISAHKKQTRKGDRKPVPSERLSDGREYNWQHHPNGQQNSRTDDSVHSCSRPWNPACSPSYRQACPELPTADTRTRGQLPRHSNSLPKSPNAAVLTSCAESADVSRPTIRATCILPSSKERSTALNTIRTSRTSVVPAKQ